MDLHDKYQEALKIQNYFHLLDYCRENNLKVCDQPYFWKDKLHHDAGNLFLHENIDALSGKQFKARYQQLVSEILRSFFYNGEYFLSDPRKPEYIYFKETEDNYGNDLEDMLDKSEELRQEANEQFPMEYVRQLYKVYITEDDFDEHAINM